MATYSSQAAVSAIRQWVDAEDDAEDVPHNSDFSEGSDAASSDEEDVLLIDGLVITDEESDNASDSDDDMDIIDENEPMDTVTDAVNAVAAGSGTIRENTGEFIRPRMVMYGQMSLLW
jgi:hypothetical protein